MYRDIINRCKYYEFCIQYFKLEYYKVLTIHCLDIYYNLPSPGMPM